MSLALEWNSGGSERGHVFADEEGHATTVVCASGWGITESGAEWSAEEVVFCPFTQRTVRESCGESLFPQLMGLLDTRKMPPGRYLLPEAAKKVPPTPPDWTLVHEESGGLRLLRYTNGSMAWVSNEDTSYVEGVDAQALDVEYSYLFPEAEKKRIGAVLVPGAPGMEGIHKLFGDGLTGLRLISEKTAAYNNWTRRIWHVENSGVLIFQTTETGAIESFYLAEKGDAYIWIAGLSRE